LSSGSCSLSTLSDGIWNVTVSDTDSAGNTSTSNSLALTIDTAQPTVSSISSTTNNGRYKAGETITVVVAFSESVTVTGSPLLTLETGVTDRTATYLSGSGSTSLLFSYVVQAGDSSSDLNYVSTSSLTLNSGSITDISGNSAVVTLPATSSGDSLGGSKAIVIDTSAPTVSSVRAASANGRYTAGSTVTIEVVMSETVTVTGTPQLSLNINGQARPVNYQSGSGTNILTFSYQVQPGDESARLEYSSTSALSLNSGSIVDAAGNSAQVTLATQGSTGSLADSSNLIIDANAPTVISANVASNGQTITVALSETLSATSASASSYSITVNGSSVAVSSLSISGSSVILTLATPIDSATAVLLSYADPSGSNDASALQDLAGNDVATFSSLNVTNGSTILTPPGAPAAPVAVSGDTQAIVSVTQPLTGGVPSSFVISASPQVSGVTKTCTVAGASGSCTVTGLTNGTSYTFTATASNVSGGTGGTSSASSASNSVIPDATPVAPQVVSTTAPRGLAKLGETLTSLVGFSGTPTPSLTYTWQACTSSTNLATCSTISGATASTYQTVLADVGKFIRSVVTATNSAAPSGVNLQTERVLK
jgi:hypothetical protein